MKTNCYFFVLLLLLPVIAGAQEIKTDLAKGTNLAAYKTFAWAEDARLKNPSVDATVRWAIEKQLLTKGFQKVKTDAELLIAYHGSTTQDVQVRVWGYNIGEGPPGNELQPVKVGTLVVDIMNAKTNLHLWRGTATETLLQDPQKLEKIIQSAVQKMFQNFPTSIGAYSLQ